MALYYKLPVYKASYELVLALFASSNNFAREYKYTIGQQLKDEGLALVKNIYRANRARDKAPALDDARENIEMIRLFLRLMQDFRQVSLKKFVEMNMAIEIVSKQLVAWGRYSQKITIGGGAPPESFGAARAQASERSESNNPLALREDYRPATGVLHESI